MSRTYTIGIVAAVVVAGVVLLSVFLLGGDDPAPAPEAPLPAHTLTHTTIGTSVEGRIIDVYTYTPTREEGARAHLLFVGGIHGGYEWNSVLLAERFLDYIQEDLKRIPSDVVVSVVPSLNPDGVYAVVGKEGHFTPADIPDGSAAHGRFNANGVDLNRNFDCKWQPTSTWRGNTVSAGNEPFSEPEAAALRDFILRHTITAAIFWQSQANAVYASECEEGILPETLLVMNAYAQAAQYRAVESFDAYPITGDVEGWLASLGIPAITVELATHEDVEWDRNLAGIEALFEHYTQQ